MRKLLFITIFIVLTACGEDKNWYVGDWVIDADISFKQAASLEKNQFSKLERRINRFKEFRVVLAKDSGKTLEANGQVDESYSLTKIDKNTIKLTEGNDEIFLYKDNSVSNGPVIYFFLNGKSASENNQTRLYLKKTSNK